MFEQTIRDAVLQVKRPGTHWFSTGWNGGFWNAPVGYSISVPDSWESRDIGAYVQQRREQAGFERSGPTLLTAVNFSHLRGARHNSVEVYATVGLSNPASLPVDLNSSNSSGMPHSNGYQPGTVNIIVCTNVSLDEGALANLLTVAVEAKTATLLQLSGFPGTTTDAVLIGINPTGPSSEFSGSGTPIGASTRACVRDALKASFASQYADTQVPASVEAAPYGVSTDFSTDVFSL